MNNILWSAEACEKYSVSRAEPGVCAVQSQAWIDDLTRVYPSTTGSEAFNALVHVLENDTPLAGLDHGSCSGTD